MNTDIDKSIDKYISPQAREELGNLSVIFWQDYYFAENRKDESSFVEENKYRNYYEGKTVIKFPYYDDAGTSSIYHTYYLDTYTTSGHLKTPYYGQAFDENKFEYAAFYQYYISFPDNIESLGKKQPGLRFVVQLFIDVALYPGTEYVTLQICDSQGYAMSPISNFENTGNVSVISTWKIKGGSKKNLTKLAQQFLLNFSGYKHDRQLGHNSFEK